MKNFDELRFLSMLPVSIELIAVKERLLNFLASQNWIENYNFIGSEFLKIVMSVVQANAIQESSSVSDVGCDENKQPILCGTSVKEVKKNNLKMQLAKIPRNSPWKKIDAVITNCNEDGKWPPAHVSATKFAEQGGASKMKTQQILRTGKEKWVPMKPSLMGGNVNWGRRSWYKKNESVFFRNGDRVPSSKIDNKVQQGQQKKAFESQKSDVQKVSDKQQQQFTHFRPSSCSRQIPSKIRYQNRSQNQDDKRSYVPRHCNVGGQISYKPCHRTTGYRPRIFASNFDAINSIFDIFRQIEYYFSMENLKNDDYLRSQLNNEGWVSFAAIASFYRLIKLSWGGDVNLIMGALREIVFNKASTVEVGRLVDQVSNKYDKSIFQNYAVRPKAWKQWVPEKPSNWQVNLQILKDDQLDEFKIVSMPLFGQQNLRTFVASSEPQASQKIIPYIVPDQSFVTEPN